MRELQKVLRSFSAEGKFARRFYNGEVLTIGDMKLAASGERRVVIRSRRTLESQTKQPGLNDDVYCLTPDYAFALRKTSETGPYLITSYSPRQPEDDLTSEVTFSFRATVLCMTDYGAFSLLSRMQSPTFVLESAERTREEGVEIIRIDYTWENEHGTESGSVHLEPARKWAIRRSDVLFTPDPPKASPENKAPPGPSPQSTRHQTEVVYQDLPGGIPFPVRTVVSVRPPDSAKMQQEHFEVERVALGDPPPEWFKLSGYGLPDVPLRPVPRGSAFSPRSPWLWGSLATALVSFALLWLLRRKPAAPAA